MSLSESMEDYLEAIFEIEKSKRAANINVQLGVGYMSQGRYDFAKTKLEKALSQDPTNADIYHYMAELYRRLGDFETAEANFQKALKLDGTNTALMNNYGVFLCSQKHYDEANEYFEKVLKDPLYQSKDLVYENMGVCSLKEGNLLKAEKYLNKAYSLNPNLPTTALNLAQINFDKQLMDQANFHFQRFLKMADHTAQSLWLGYLLEMQNGNKNQAASYAVLLKGKYPESNEAKLLQKHETRKNK